MYVDEEKPENYFTKDELIKFLDHVEKTDNPNGIPFSGYWPSQDAEKERSLRLPGMTLISKRTRSV